MSKDRVSTVSFLSFLQSETEPIYIAKYQSNASVFRMHLSPYLIMRPEIFASCFPLAWVKLIFFFALLRQQFPTYESFNLAPAFWYVSQKFFFSCFWEASERINSLKISNVVFFHIPDIVLALSFIFLIIESRPFVIRIVERVDLHLTIQVLRLLILLGNFQEQMRSVNSETGHQS